MAKSYYCLQDYHVQCRESDLDLSFCECECHAEFRNQPESSLNKREPPPTVSSGPPIWELVMDDMRARDKLGVVKYGMRLRANNGRNSLLDAYQEALDLAVYLRQAIEEGK